MALQFRPAFCSYAGHRLRSCLLQGPKPQVTHCQAHTRGLPGTASTTLGNCLSPISSISLTKRSQLLRGAHTTCHASNFAKLYPDGSYDVTFQGVQQVLARTAAPDSSWPEEARTAVAAAADFLGGSFFLVQCGNWLEGPGAGQPAFAVLQLVLVAMTPPTASAKRGQPVIIQAPQEVPESYAAFIVYELDSNGWPTGAAYNTASSYEGMTDRVAFKKPINSIRLWLNGLEGPLMATYLRNRLEKFNVRVVPKAHQRSIMDMLHAKLLDAGVKIYTLEDAVSMARRSGAATGGAKDNTGKPKQAPRPPQAPQPPQAPRLPQAPQAKQAQQPTPGRARRTRKTGPAAAE